MVRKREGLLNLEERDRWMNLSRSVGRKGFSSIKLSRISWAVFKANVGTRRSKRGTLSLRVEQGSASSLLEPWAHTNPVPFLVVEAFLPWLYQLLKFLQP